MVSELFVHAAYSCLWSYSDIDLDAPFPSKKGFLYNLADRTQLIMGCLDV